MDGQNPQTGVAFDQRNHLYGTAALGGVDGNGIIHHLAPPNGISVARTARLYPKSITLSQQGIGGKKREAYSGAP